MHVLPFSKKSTNSIQVGYRRETVLRRCSRQAVPKNKNREKGKKRKTCKMSLKWKIFFHYYLATPGLVKRAVPDPPIPGGIVS